MYNDNDLYSNSGDNGEAYWMWWCGETKKRKCGKPTDETGQKEGKDFEGCEINGKEATIDIKNTLDLFTMRHDRSLMIFCQRYPMFVDNGAEYMSAVKVPRGTEPKHYTLEMMMVEPMKTNDFLTKYWFKDERCLQKVRENLDRFKFKTFKELDYVSLSQAFRDIKYNLINPYVKDGIGVSYDDPKDYDNRNPVLRLVKKKTEGEQYA